MLGPTAAAVSTLRGTSAKGQGRGCPAKETWRVPRGRPGHGACKNPEPQRPWAMRHFMANGALFLPRWVSTQALGMREEMHPGNQAGWLPVQGRATSPPPDGGRFGCLTPGTHQRLNSTPHQRLLHPSVPRGRAKQESPGLAWGRLPRCSSGRLPDVCQGGCGRGLLGPLREPLLGWGRSLLPSNRRAWRVPVAGRRGAPRLLGTRCL